MMQVESFRFDTSEEKEELNEFLMGAVVKKILMAVDESGIIIVVAYNK